MSLYVGTCTPGAMDWIVTVDDDVLPPRNDLFNHSPDGFAWGYPGSGPSQLALAILSHHFRSYSDDETAADNLAIKLHQQFKQAVIAQLPMEEGFTLTSAQVQEAVDKLDDPPAAVPRLTVLFTNGKRQHVTPVDGERFHLRELQELVGGYIEAVRVPSMPKFYLLVDEEGLLKHKPVNAEATGYAQQRIVGTALLIARRHFT